ncbi:MAG: FAD:protein FMN transferase [Pararhodobacter sp.]
MVPRRRMLAIMAASLATGGAAAAATAADVAGAGLAALATPDGDAIAQWRGVALGADASITLAHPQAEAMLARARTEIDRLEGIFSLYRRDSALARLNAEGRLEAPPFELLECLGQCARVHALSGGLFDPTIQPLWALYAAHFAAAGRAGLPSRQARAEVMRRTGWERVAFDAGAVRLAPGMALSLNGIAQGYIADRVADLLRGWGLDDVLVNTGELHALGGDPRGGDWLVGLRAGGRVLRERVALRDGALASSAVGGTVFDAAGRVGHILDPLRGLPAPQRWQLVTVQAPRAWLADALSTAFCLMEAPAIAAALASEPRARLVRLLAQDQPRAG